MGDRRSRQGAGGGGGDGVGEWCRSLEVGGRSGAAGGIVEHRRATTSRGCACTVMRRPAPLNVHEAARRASTCWGLGSSCGWAVAAPDAPRRRDRAGAPRGRARLPRGRQGAVALGPSAPPGGFVEFQRRGQHDRRAPRGDRAGRAAGRRAPRPHRGRPTASPSSVRPARCPRDAARLPHNGSCVGSGGGRGGGGLGGVGVRSSP